MYLFTRRLRLNGTDMPAAMALVMDITEQVRQVTGQPTNLWAEFLSPEAGMLVWTAQTDDLTTLEASFDKLMVDTRFQELSSRGLTSYTIPGTLMDRLSTYVHASGADSLESAAYVGVVNSQLTNGHFGTGVGIGVEIAQLAEEITGIRTSFLMHNTGGYASCAWHSYYRDLAALQHAEVALYADSRFPELLDTKAAAVFADAPSATTQKLYRKVL